MRSGGVALDADCRVGGTFAFSAIRLKTAFSKISYCIFKLVMFIVCIGLLNYVF